MKPVVALDLDDIIYPFMGELLPYFNRRRGTNFTVDDFHTFDFEDVWGGTREEAIATVMDFFANIERHPEPLHGAEAAIGKLSDHFDLVIVTSREDSLHEATITWVNRHFPTHFAAVHLCNSYVLDDRPTKRTKASVCDELDAVALVDDSLANVTAVAATGRRGILFGNYAWNKIEVLPPRVTRAADWDDVLDQLLELAS